MIPRLSVLLCDFCSRATQFSKIYSNVCIVFGSPRICWIARRRSRSSGRIATVVWFDIATRPDEYDARSELGPTFTAPDRYRALLCVRPEPRPLLTDSFCGPSTSGKNSLDCEQSRESPSRISISTWIESTLLSPPTMWSSLINLSVEGGENNHLATGSGGVRPYPYRSDRLNFWYLRRIWNFYRRSGFRSGNWYMLTGGYAPF